MHGKRRNNNGMGGSGGQHRHQNNRPRRFGSGSSNRPGDDNANVARNRRHAQQQREKYQNMARDAMSMGDRVLAENYLQHADHFHRVIISLPPEEPRHQHQQRNAAGEVIANEGQMGDQSDPAHDNMPEPMPSADALPSFITQQPMVSHNPQNFEE
jgi:hypothetical protein